MPEPSKGLLHQAVERWTRAADSDPVELEQSAADQLLAEHHLMAEVLEAMEAEATKSIRGAELRTEFWADAVDFNGNFVHLCHRVKEETCFIPAAVRCGVIDTATCEEIKRQHHDAAETTMNLCRAVEDSDWERVLRLVSMHQHVMQPHMRLEEQKLVLPSKSVFDAETEAELRRGFGEVEARALAGRGRRHYIELARRLRQDSGVAE